MEDRFQKIHRYVENKLGTGGSHDMGHINRVTNLCGIIGRSEGADREILIPAALLHDIARPEERADGTPHEIAGADIADAYLRSVGYDPGRIPAIVHAIRTHRFRSREEPGTLEARILSDADKLDAMGATGIGRTFMRAGEHGGTMEDATGHIRGKLLVLHERMYTRTAREMAMSRHAFLVAFIARFEEEIAIPPDF